MLIAAAACAILAGCGQSDDALRQANASGNAASAALENAVAQADAAPLEKEQALALMKERHHNYERIGDAMKAISRELKADDPDLAKVRAGADTIATLAPQVPTWFPAGTGPEAGKTHARAEIWAKPEDFSAKAVAFDRAAFAFQAATRGGNVDQVRTAHGDLGKSCKACHDVYRAKVD
jgi:cytochrome c556